MIVSVRLAVLTTRLPTDASLARGAGSISVCFTALEKASCGWKMSFSCWVLCVCILTMLTPKNDLDVIYFSCFLGDWITLDPYTSAVRINAAVWSYCSVFVVFLHIFYSFLSKYNFWYDCFVTGRSTVEGQGVEKGHVSLLFMTPPWLRIFLLIYVTKFVFWIIFQRHSSTQEFCVKTFFSSFFPVIFSLCCFIVTCRSLTC